MSDHILKGIVDDFGNLTPVWQLPHYVYMQRYNYFKATP